MDELRAIHHVALTVTDCDCAARWYTTVLGMEEQFSEDDEHRRARVLRFTGGGFSVGLVEHLPTPESGFDPRHVGLDHLAFSVGTRQQLDQWADRLRDHGVDHSGVLEIPSGAILNFKDPEGIALALFWDAPPATKND